MAWPCTTTVLVLESCPPGAGADSCDGGIAGNRKHFSNVQAMIPLVVGLYRKQIAPSLRAKASVMCGKGHPPCPCSLDRDAPDACNTGMDMPCLWHEGATKTFGVSIKASAL